MVSKPTYECITLNVKQYLWRAHLAAFKQPSILPREIPHVLFMNINCLPFLHELG